MSGNAGGNMREIRAIVNGIFLFAVFLLVYAFVRPGHTRASSHPPHFVRMTVEEGHGRPRTFSFAVPYGFVRGALRALAMGDLKKELELHFTDTVEAEEMKQVWDELKSKPDGTEVVREHDSEHFGFKKDGAFVAVTVTKPEDPDDRVTLRVPASVMESMVASEKDFDVDAVLAELQDAARGDLVDVKNRDSHVRIWID